MKKTYLSILLVGGCLAACTPTNQVVTDVDLEIEALSHVQPTYDAFKLKQKNLPSITAEVVDEFYHHDEELSSWIDVVKKSQGVYVQTYGDYQYVVLATGEQPCSGFGVAFLGAYQENQTIYVVYSLITPDVTESGSPSYPFSLLRFPNSTDSQFKSVWVNEDDIALFLS